MCRPSFFISALIFFSFSAITRFIVRVWYCLWMRDEGLSLSTKRDELNVHFLLHVGVIIEFFIWYWGNVFRFFYLAAEGGGWIWVLFLNTILIVLTDHNLFNVLFWALAHRIFSTVLIANLPTPFEGGQTSRILAQVLITPTWKYVILQTRVLAFLPAFGIVYVFGPNANLIKAD